MALYEKPVRLLMHDMVADLGLKKGEILAVDLRIEEEAHGGLPMKPSCVP